MTRGKAIVLLLLFLVVAAVGYLLWLVNTHGFSAREEPTRVEAWLARHARRIATPADAKNLQDPYYATEANLAPARQHFVEHCATCHALNGSGNTVFGRNMYPKVPDLRDQQTQKLTDGELYYIISNGVRFTGMPAFGGEDSQEEIWKLVLFIRRLPNLPPEELREMQRMATGAESEEPAAERTPGHTSTDRHPPGTKPHKP